MRIGIGYDVHPLVQGRRLMLGGVEIPFDRGLDGHSDGDVLVHSIIDALLGAACLRDIGSHFPSSDPQYKDISSLNLLHYVGGLLLDHGWKVGNIDTTVVAERPRLLDFIPTMRQRIGDTLGIGVEKVSVKGTTSKRLGFLGEEEGIAAHAVALIEEIEEGHLCH